MTNGPRRDRHFRSRLRQSVPEVGGTKVLRYVPLAATILAATLVGTALAVSGSNTITTVAGRSMFPGFAGDGGPATRALFGGFNYIEVDRQGSLYIADTAGYRIRKVNPRGTISTIACNGKVGFTGDGGPAKSARCRPVGIAVDARGTVYFTDADNGRIRKIANGRITVVAGIGGLQGFSGDGGPATRAQLAGPNGLAVDSTGNVYVADTENNRIRRITPGGTITTFAGTGTRGFSGDGGPATAAELADPFDVATDPLGDVYVADAGNKRLRKVGPDGTITTVASVDVLGIAVGRQGEIYASGDSRVRKVAANGTVTVVAGNGKSGFSGDYGPAAKARLFGAIGVAVDAKGDLYIGDGENRRIRKVWNGPAPKRPKR
jgi:hypothetical protein